jgi:site-specific recombinase XerD
MTGFYNKVIRQSVIVMSYAKRRLCYKYLRTVNVWRRGAFHLFESGTNFCCIQTQRRHKSSKTTELYTHVSNKALGQEPSHLNVCTYENKQA